MFRILSSSPSRKTVWSFRSFTVPLDKPAGPDDPVRLHAKSSAHTGLIDPFFALRHVLASQFGLAAQLVPTGSIGFDRRFTAGFPTRRSLIRCSLPEGVFAGDRCLLVPGPDRDAERTRLFPEWPSWRIEPRLDGCVW